MVVLVKAGGHAIQFAVGLPYVIVWRFDGFTNPALSDLVHDLLFVNIWWGLLNLLPILPLDGGQITNQVFNITYPHGALRTTLVISLVVATAMAVSGVSRPPDWFRIVLFGSLAYGSYQMLAAYGGRFRQ